MAPMRYRPTNRLGDALDGRGFPNRFHPPRTPRNCDDGSAAVTRLLRIAWGFDRSDTACPLRPTGARAFGVGLYHFAGDGQR